MTRIMTSMNRGIRIELLILKMTNNFIFTVVKHPYTFRIWKKLSLSDYKCYLYNG